MWVLDSCPMGIPASTRYKTSQNIIHGHPGAKQRSIVGPQTLKEGTIGKIGKHLACRARRSIPILAVSIRAPPALQNSAYYVCKLFNDSLRLPLPAKVRTGYLKL